MCVCSQFSIFVGETSQIANTNKHEQIMQILCVLCSATRIRNLIYALKMIVFFVLIKNTDYFLKISKERKNDRKLMFFLFLFHRCQFNI